LRVPNPSTVLMVGAGIIGRLAAWRLAEAGHQVSLVDPALAAPPTANSPDAGHPASLSGSQAALGVLMARVFHRSSGRAWQLRQRSQALWGEWLAELERRDHRLPRRQGLLLLAATPEELERQKRIADDRARLGIPMQRLGPEDLAALTPALPGRPLGALLSPEDGQIDPRPLLDALLQEARRAGCTRVAETAVALERGPGGAEPRWRLRLAGGAALEADWLVLGLGLGTGTLLATLGLELPLEPVLGQALELELASTPAWSWPGVVVWRGVNLVPRPDLPGGKRLWLGATLEPGQTADPVALASLRDLDGAAPDWLRAATVLRPWQGWRARPRDRPAPVLEEPEPGLLLASGHYRNGVLLAPATADWLLERITNPRTGQS
jgi:glycine/D-amino acid oxidase-like deaminating enzyme